MYSTPLIKRKDASGKYDHNLLCCSHYVILILRKHDSTPITGTSMLMLEKNKC